MQDRPVLASVQMPPLPLWLMVVLWARFPTLWARPLLNLVVFKMNVNLALSELQFHLFNEPGSPDPQNLCVQLSVLHGPHFPMQNRLPSHYKAGIPRNVQAG
jgi:hypothetical protein